MQYNIGTTDRIVRLVLGVLLGALGVAVFADLVALGTPIGAVALLVGVILVATGVLRMCPLYQVVDVDTSGSRS